MNHRQTEIQWREDGHWTDRLRVISVNYSVHCNSISVCNCPMITIVNMDSLSVLALRSKLRTLSGDSSQNRSINPFLLNVSPRPIVGFVSNKNSRNHFIIISRGSVNVTKSNLNEGEINLLNPPGSFVGHPHRTGSSTWSWSTTVGNRFNSYANDGISFTWLIVAGSFIIISIHPGRSMLNRMVIPTWVGLKWDSKWRLLNQPSKWPAAAAAAASPEAVWLVSK